MFKNLNADPFTPPASLELHHYLQPRSNAASHLIIENLTNKLLPEKKNPEFTFSTTLLTDFSDQNAIF